MVHEGEPTLLRTAPWEFGWPRQDPGCGSLFGELCPPSMKGATEDPFALLPLAPVNAVNSAARMGRVWPSSRQARPDRFRRVPLG